MVEGDMSFAFLWMDWGRRRGGGEEVGFWVE